MGCLLHGLTTTSEAIHNYFSQMVHDYFLWQLVNFATRNDNFLDLVLPNTPDIILNLEGRDDIINIDHKILKFQPTLKIHRKTKLDKKSCSFT